MHKELNTNRDVWDRMFDWIHSYGGHRRYTNETVVIWLLGYARTGHEVKRALDVGCGWSQCLPLFMNEGFEYVGVDVTENAFLPTELLENTGYKDRTTLKLFTPPKLDFPDRHFSHCISTEALHLNSTGDSMRAMIGEIHRTLMDGGRFMATCMTPDYWYMPLGTADWISDETIRVSERHIEAERHGATYFVFRDEEHIKEYFKDFSKVWIGKEQRMFGEFPDKDLHHWIISAEK